MSLGSNDADLANDTIDFDVTVANSVSIHENEIEGLNIYPNPAKDFVTVELADANNDGQVEILNLLGQVVLTQSLIEGTSSSINITNLKAAVYLIKVTSNGKSSTRKIVIH